MQDRQFAAALLDFELLETALLQERIALIEDHPATKDRLFDWLNANR